MNQKDNSFDFRMIDLINSDIEKIKNTLNQTNYTIERSNNREYSVLIVDLMGQVTFGEMENLIMILKSPESSYGVWVSFIAEEHKGLFEIPEKVIKACKMLKGNIDFSFSYLGIDEDYFQSKCDLEGPGVYYSLFLQNAISNELDDIKEAFKDEEFDDYFKNIRGKEELLLPRHDSKLLEKLQEYMRQKPEMMFGLGVHFVTENDMDGFTVPEEIRGILRLTTGAVSFSYRVIP